MTQDDTPKDFEPYPDLPENREPPTVTEKMDMRRELPRKDRLIERLRPGESVGWDPAEDDALLRFIAVREAGFELGFDICKDYETWERVSNNIDIATYGYMAQLSGVEFGSEKIPDDVVTLNQERDWELLKKVTAFDRDTANVSAAKDMLRGLEVG